MLCNVIQICSVLPVIDWQSGELQEMRQFAFLQLLYNYINSLLWVTVIEANFRTGTLRAIRFELSLRPMVTKTQCIGLQLLIKLDVQH